MTNLISPSRCRLASLWVSQLARVLADNWLRFFVVLVLAREWHNHIDQAWQFVALLWTLPMFLLAPCNGALCNSLPKPYVFIASTLLGLLTVLGSMVDVLPWTVCWGLIAISFAVYGPVRYAFLPAASDNTGVSLPRINGFFEAGAAVGVVGGILLGGRFLLPLFGVVHESAFDRTSTTTVCVLGLHVVALLFALPVRFAGDVYRRDRGLQAVRGFFRDCGRVWEVPRSRGCLLALAMLKAITIAFTGAVLLEYKIGHDGEVDNIARLAQLLVWLMGGVAAGSFLAGLAKHPVRSLGLVPIGTCAFAVALCLVSLNVAVGEILCVVLGAASSFVNVPLSAAYQASLPADARGNGMAARNFCDYAVTTALVGLLLGLTFLAGLSAQGQFWLLTLLAAVLAVVSVRLLYVELMHLVLEIMLIPFYKVTAQGPGASGFPRAGPVLVIANHSAWLDPVWLGKVLPRQFVPMMTSRYYDKPGVRWLFEHVARAIRVQESRFRRSVPELDQAIKTLDRGEVLLLFPEGGLRRREDQPLRQFGQGVWHILRERPATPVVVCWIEGGWGSFLSMYKGPPTRNKPVDFRRPIRIAVSLPQTLPADVLADPRATRSFLMEQCLQARQLLGLSVLGLDKLPEESAEGAVQGN